MKVGIAPINLNMSPEQMVAVAQKAEEVGLESLWTFEHVIVPLHYESRYPYSPNGKMSASPETPFVDPLITLGFLAAHTKRLRLGTGVNIAPQAKPLLLAKQAASIDYLSQGRLLLGLGTGWLREEYEALGTPFERRGARFDDAIIAMKKVWSGDVVEHKSEFLNWSNFKSYPLPVQRPHPPIIIGGAKGAALRRVVQHGDGWFVPDSGVERLRPQIEAMHQLAREHGRDPSGIELTTMWPFQFDPGGIPRYRDLGVQRLVVIAQALGTANPVEGITRVLDGLGNAIAKSA